MDSIRVLPILFFALAIFSATKCRTSDELSIHQIDSERLAESKRPSEWADKVTQMASMDTGRLAYLSNMASHKLGSPVGPVAQSWIFVVRGSLGSQNQTVYMVLDTSSDNTWVQCAGCIGCKSTTFSPNSSSTYATLGCSAKQCGLVHGLRLCSTVSPRNATCSYNQNQSYCGTSASFSADLSIDSLTLGASVVHNFTFGCITNTTGSSLAAQGLLGLGRGPLSLLGQAGVLYSSVFSYLLPSLNSKYMSGSLILGPSGQPTARNKTMLLRNPRRMALYYVNLTAVSIGNARVPMKNLFNPNTGSGTVIDTSTTLTRFARMDYQSIRDEFKSQMDVNFSSVGGFDTCFPITGETNVPAVTLHFSELDLELPAGNAMIHRASGSMACLAMAATPYNGSSVLNVIGNYQQQNLRVIINDKGGQESHVSLDWVVA